MDRGGAARAKGGKKGGKGGEEEEERGAERGRLRVLPPPKLPPQNHTSSQKLRVKEKQGGYCLSPSGTSTLWASLLPLGALLFSLLHLLPVFYPF